MSQLPSKHSFTPPPPGALVRLLLVCLVLVLPSACHCQRADFKLLDRQKNRIFWLSSSSPMTATLNKYALPTHIKVIISHLNHVENAILSTLARSNNRSMTPSTTGSDIRACNYLERSWRTGVRNTFGQRGWNEPEHNCVSDVEHEDLAGSTEKGALHSLDAVYEAIYARGELMRKNGRAIVVDMLKNTYVDTSNNFTEPDFVYNWGYKKATQECVLHPVAAVRIGAGGRWHVGTGIHNKNKDARLPNFGRHNIIEYSTIGENNTLQNELRMNVFVRTKDASKRFQRNDTTSVVVSWRGAGNPSAFSALKIADNGAIVSSLEKGEVFVQQAQDAITASNVAILALPLLLNVVPIALLADVSTCAAVMYTILSDVLTTIPVLIKGVELLVISYDKHRSVIVRMSSATAIGGVVGRSENAAAEIWAAECRVDAKVRTHGWIFVGVGAVFLIVGVAAEVFSREYARRRRAERRRRLGWAEWRWLKSEMGWERDREKGIGAGNAVFGTEKYEEVG